MDTQFPTNAVSRRNFLKMVSMTGAVLAAGSASTLLAACGGSGEAQSDAPLDEFDVKLAWIPNVEYAGLFVAADRGLYSDAGVAPELVPGGPNSPVVPLVESGKALIGVEAIPENVVNAVNGGSPLRVVGAMFQRSPEAWVSLAEDPIEQPSDIEGKRLGVTLSGQNTALVFMRENGVDTTKVELVPIQFDPAPLPAGEIDALWGLASNQPVSLALRGHDPVVMPLADYGFNRMQNVLFVHEDTLADDAKSSQVSAFLHAGEKGWAEALDDPQAAAEITVSQYGEDLGLDLDEQVKSLDAVVPFIAREDDGNSQFWMSEQLVDETVQSLGLIGVEADPAIFTNELLA